MTTVRLILLSSGEDDMKILSVQGAPKRSPACILVVPGADVLGREIAAAGSTPAQRRATALSQLAADLAAPAAQLTCAIGSGRNGQTAFVASRKQVEGWRDRATRAGQAPDLILPDYALLPRPSAGVACVAHRDDSIVRTARAGFACQPDLLGALTNGLQIEEVDFERAAVAAVRSGAVMESPDLLGALREAAASRSRYLPALTAGAAAAALVVASVVPWVDAIRINAETSALHAKTAEIARAALPDARRIVDPLAQLREAARPHLGSETLLQTSAGLLEGLSLAPNVKLSRLELGEDGAVRASLSTPDLIQLQPLRDHLSSLGLRATETPGNSSPNQQNVELLLTGAS
jgi:type II secretion system protein L